MKTLETTKHTPGPWTNNPLQDTIWANDGDLKIATIADLPWVETPSGRRCSDSATEQANARLIAAAPALLEALQNAADQLDNLKSWFREPRYSDPSRTEWEATNAVKSARAAIAQATGN